MSPNSELTQGALNTAIDKGSLDLKIFDVDYEPDMEIDGEVLGELEEVKGAAAAQALLQASNDKKRRSAFYSKQSHAAFVYYFFEVADTLYVQKAEEILIAAWSDDGLTQAGASQQAQELWGRFSTALQAKAELHILESLLTYTTDRSRWQVDHEGAGSDHYLGMVQSAALVLRKGLDVKLSDQGIADLVWNHLRASDRALLKGETYTNPAGDECSLKTSFVQLMTMDEILAATGDNYKYSDSQVEQKRLTAWLTKGIGAKVLKHWNFLAGKAKETLKEDKVSGRPAPKTNPQPAARPPPKHKCGKCGKWGTHTEKECRGTDQGKAQDPKPASKPSKPGKETARDPAKQKLKCWNCGEEGHGVNKCAKPKQKPFPFKPGGATNFLEPAGVPDQGNFAVEETLLSPAKLRANASRHSKSLPAPRRC